MVWKFGKKMMANRLAASSRTNVIIFFAIFATPAGCHKQAAEDSASHKCFSVFERLDPGKITLSQPVSCSNTSPKYRLEGTIERPDVVTQLDEDGRIRATFRIEYDQKDRPKFEERILHIEPPSIKIYSQGDRMEFVRPIRKKWQIVRIMTELDAAGRVVKMEKYNGAERAFSLVKEYAGANLVMEAAFDKDGKLKYRSTFKKIGTKTVERMMDGSGKILLERELVQDRQGSTEVLDTSGHSPVQVGNSRDTNGIQVSGPIK